MNTKTNFPVGDFLIRVKNVAMAKGKKLTVPSTKQIVAVSECMKKAGYFDEIKKGKEGLEISLAFKDKKPLLINVNLISKPGRRIYLGASEIAKKKGPSFYLISTPKGILTTREAIKANQGGEIIAEIL